MTPAPSLMILSSIEYSAISTSLASTTLAGTTLASTTLTHHKDKVYVIYLTYNIKDSTKMQGEPGNPGNHDHHQSSSNQIVDRREQGV